MASATSTLAGVQRMMTCIQGVLFYDYIQSGNIIIKQLLDLHVRVQVYTCTRVHINETHIIYRSILF